MQYNPTRWVCQVDARYCDGFFYVYGQKRRCPLLKKCCGHDRQLEYFHPQEAKNQRVLRQPPDPKWQAQHRYNLNRIRRAFMTPEERHAVCVDRKEYMAIYHQNHRKLSKGRACPEDIPLPPCGYSCEDEGGACPYPDACRYANWEAEQIAKIRAERTLARQARSHAAEAERMKDPEFRAKRNDYKAAWKRDRRTRETPEERESRLAKERERRARRLARETPEEREARLAERRAAYQEKKRK